MAITTKTQERVTPATPDRPDWEARIDALAATVQKLEEVVQGLLEDQRMAGRRPHRGLIPQESAEGGS